LYSEFIDSIPAELLIMPFAKYSTTLALFAIARHDWLPQNVRLSGDPPAWQSLDRFRHLKPAYLVRYGVLNCAKKSPILYGRSELDTGIINQSLDRSNYLVIILGNKKKAGSNNPELQAKKHVGLNGLLRAS
jgi:hypothetical protein